MQNLMSRSVLGDKTSVQYTAKPIAQQSESKGQLFCFTSHSGFIRLLFRTFLLHTDFLHQVTELRWILYVLMLRESCPRIDPLGTASTIKKVE